MRLKIRKEPAAGVQGEPDHSLGSSYFEIKVPIPCRPRCKAQRLRGEVEVGSYSLVLDRTFWYLLRQFWYRTVSGLAYLNV